METVERILDDAAAIHADMVALEADIEALEAFAPPWLRKLAAPEAFRLLDDRIAESRESLRRLKAKRARIAFRFDSLPGIEGRVMRLRYLEGRRWRDIAEALNYSETYLRGDMLRKAKEHMRVRPA